MKPNFLGSKSMFFNPSIISFNTAEIGLIDTAISPSVISPYAYTAVVRDDYDAANFNLDAAGVSLVAGQRVAFGLFLSPQNHLGNLLFQLTGKVMLTATLGTFGGLTGSFFFGRKATNNTVVSSKAAASNTLASYMLLPSTAVNMVTSGAPGVLNDNLESELFSLYLEDGFVYCFGYLLDSVQVASAIVGGMSLALRKYSTEIPEFHPTGQ